MRVEGPIPAAMLTDTTGAGGPNNYFEASSAAIKPKSKPDQNRIKVESKSEQRRKVAQSGTEWHNRWHKVAHTTCGGVRIYPPHRWWGTSPTVARRYLTACGFAPSSAAIISRAAASISPFAPCCVNGRAICSLTMPFTWEIWPFMPRARPRGQAKRNSVGDTQSQVAWYCCANTCAIFSIAAGTSWHRSAHRQDRSIDELEAMPPHYAVRFACQAGAVFAVQTTMSRIGSLLATGDPRLQHAALAELVDAFGECGGNVSAIAARLRVARRTVSRWVDEYPAIAAALASSRMASRMTRGAVPHRAPRA